MPRFCANLTMLYNELDFLDRFEAAAKDGFWGVEYLFPYAYPKEELLERLDRAGLTQVLHNLPAGDWAGGDRGIACQPERAEEFRAGVDKAIEYATALGCRQLNCLAGIPAAGSSPEEARRTLVENLRFAAPKLADAGIKLLLEPVNSRDVKGFFVDRSNQAVEIIDEVGSDNLYLQYDFYHTQVMEGDVVATFGRLKDRIAHVQIADEPGRHEPGTGDMDYAAVFETLDREGYKGWVGCEYKPKAGTSEGLGWFAPHRSRRV